MLGLGNRGQVEVGPATLFQQVTDQVVRVQALHDDHDGVGNLVVEAREQGVAIPLLGGFSDGFRGGVLWLRGVIDDDEIPAAAGEGAPDRSR